MKGKRRRRGDQSVTKVTEDVVEDKDDGEQRLPFFASWFEKSRGRETEARYESGLFFHIGQP